MIVAIIQARVGSKRFPNKIFANICGKPLIYHVVNRLKKCKEVDKIVIATTKNYLDNPIEAWAIANRVSFFRGEEEDVLSRFYFAAKKFKADIVVRITADDPFKDYVLIDNLIEKLITDKLMFVYNNNPPTFPEGLDTEIFTFDALKTAFNEVSDPYEKEHVTQYFYKNPKIFKQQNVLNDEDISYLRWTIDMPEDLEMTRRIYEELYRGNDFFLTKDILNLLNENPEISEINKNVKRSDMYLEKM